MNWKKAALGLMAGLVSATILAGCGGGGGTKTDGDPKKPAATPSAQLEL